MTRTIPMSLIFQAAMRQGLKRPVAQVLAVIVYWHQIEGGRQIKGRRMRWRTAREIGEEVGYSERSVTRALAELRAEAFIESQVIWSPSNVGTRVNAFGLLQRGVALLDAIERPEKRGRNRQIDQFDGDSLARSGPTSPPVRERRTGRIKYSEQDQETGTELGTLPQAGESLFHLFGMEDLQEEAIGRWFSEYLRGVNLTKEGFPRAFWTGLEIAVEELGRRRIEPWSEEIGKRVEKFLSNFAPSRAVKFSPFDAPAAAVWAMLNPDRFAMSVECDTGRRPTGLGASSYQLGANGHVLVNRLLSARDDSARQAGGEQDAMVFLTDNFS